jgi:hypothetical protein
MVTEDKSIWPTKARLKGCEKKQIMTHHLEAFRIEGRLVAARSLQSEQSGFYRAEKASCSSLQLF